MPELEFFLFNIFVPKILQANRNNLAVFNRYENNRLELVIIVYKKREFRKIILNENIIRKNLRKYLEGYQTGSLFVEFNFQFRSP